MCFLFLFLFFFFFFFSFFFFFFFFFLFFFSFFLFFFSFFFFFFFVCFFLCLFVLRVLFFCPFSSSSWCRGMAVVCDCDTPWTFLLTFLEFKKYVHFQFQP